MSKPRGCSAPSTTTRPAIPRPKTAIPKRLRPIELDPSWRKPVKGKTLQEKGERGALLHRCQLLRRSLRLRAGVGVGGRVTPRRRSAD